MDPTQSDSTPEPGPVMVMKKRSQTDRIRAKLMGLPREHRFEVIDDDGDTETILMIAPKIKRAGLIVKECMKMPEGKDSEDLKASDVELDIEKLKVLAIIECLRDIDTREQVFSLANRDELLDGHLSYLYNQLGEHAMSLVHPKHKKIKKNSDEIPSA